MHLACYRAGRLKVLFNTAPNQGPTAQATDPGSAEFGNPPQLPHGFDRTLPKREPLEWPEPPAPKPSYIGWVLRDLARRIPEPIVADCYPEAEAEQSVTPLSKPPWQSPQNDGKNLESVLSGLSNTQGYNSRVEKGWLLLRYREAYWEANRPETPKAPAASRR